MAAVEDAGFTDEPPTIETWGVFSSPCDGVVWDSFHHAWLAQPVMNGSLEPDRSFHEPELFAPAELGMEGAKLAAVRCRRALEAEHLQVLQEEHGQWPQQLCNHMLSAAADYQGAPLQPELDIELQETRTIFPSALLSNASPPSDLAASKAMPPFERVGLSNKLTKKGAPRPAPSLQQRLRQPARPARSASPTQADPPDRRRTRQPRQAVAAPCRDLSPVQRHASPPKFTQQGGATSSSASPSGIGHGGRSSKNTSSQVGRSETNRRRGAATPPQADFRPLQPSSRAEFKDETVLKSSDSQNSEVMAQFAQLWRKLEEVQEEAQRERSEKEELRQRNENLEKRLDALNSEIAAGRAGLSGSRSVPLAEVNACTCAGPFAIKAPSPPKSLTSSFRQVASDRRDTSQGLDSVPLSLPVSVRPPLRQSLPSQKQRLLADGGGINGHLPVQFQHQLASNASAPSLSGGRSSTLGAPNSKSPAASPLTDGRVAIGFTTAITGLNPPAGPTMVRAPTSVQVRDVRWTPTMTGSTSCLHGIPLVQTVVPATLRGTSPPGTRYTLLPVMSTSPRM